MRAVACLVGTLLIWITLGCASDPSSGYAMTSAHRQDVESVAVPIWENQTFNAGIEARLTEALIKELRRSTAWNIRAGGAATTLSGRVRGVSLRQLSRNQDSGLTQELAVEINVDFDWRDNATGRTLVARRNFRSTGTFVPAQGLQERLATGEQDAIQTLARDIVAELRDAW